MRREWGPAHTNTGSDGYERPAEGAVVAFERRAWEVVLVTDTEPTDEETDRLNAYVQPYRDRARPYRIRLRRVHGEPHEQENTHQEIQLRVPARCYRPFPEYKHGRVPLCSCHGHPWPCLEADQQKQAERAMQRAEHELKLLPGCCPACQEPVTQRQKGIVFPGEYTRNPLAAPNPVFHLRRKCWGAAQRYENEWVAADRTRPRSLLTLRCEGTLIVHHDGTGECFGANGSDCPSIFASHRGMSACYFQSHGCGQGCARAGHPGTRLSNRPSDPRAVTRVEQRAT